MLENYLKSYPFLTQSEIEAFLNVVTPKHLIKGDFLISQGKVSKHIAFIQSGILRSFYHSSEIEEVTYCFTFQNTLITAYTSWILEQPTSENIQALTDSELLLISKNQVNRLEENYPNWIRFFKKVAENEFVNLEKRVFMLQRESAVTRYRNLLENQPEYLHSIPLQYLASYLGVTQRHLSRIRKSITF